VGGRKAVVACEEEILDHEQCAGVTSLDVSSCWRWCFPSFSLSLSMPFVFFPSIP
jgi:hypothetical protein